MVQFTKQKNAQDGQKLHTIIMRNPRLNLLPARHSSRLRVRNHIHQRNTIQPNHLLKVDKPALVPVHVVERYAKVGAVAVGFHDHAPERLWELGGGEVHEDGVCARFEDGVGLVELC